MAETHPIRRVGTRAALLSIGIALGVTLAPRVVGAVDEPAPPVDTETVSTLPVPLTVGPAATSTSTSSTSTSSSTTTTTVATTPPPTTPPELIPPLVDFRQPAEVADAVQISRVTRVPDRTERPRAAIAAGAELPFTGGGTASIVMSGLTALAIGGVAVWWGSRKRAELIPVETNPTE